MNKLCLFVITIAAGFIQSLASAQTANCPADLNFDRAVNAADLGELLLEFGPCFECPSDLDGDGVVNSSDISLMLLDFGACPEGPGDNPCPAWGSVVASGGPEPILYNDLTVGMRWWDIVSTGWQRFTSSSPDGECTTFNSNYQSVCYDYGTTIRVDAQFTYYADGNCAYFTGPTTPPNPCPAEKTIAAVDRSFAITVTPSEGDCGETYTVGRAVRIQYHDGQCGLYWGWPINPHYTPFGTQIGSCDGWSFLSNGTGGYVAIRTCPPAGQVMEEISRTEVTVTVNGMYTWTVGDEVVVAETDGECGTREATQYEWLPYGTILGSDGIYDYYSDGNGWYYTVPIGCPSSGTVISSTSNGIFINVIGMDWLVGTYYTTTFADGNCNSYDLSSTEYLPYGTLLGSDSNSNYYSDGAGSYYTDTISCPAYGTMISGSSWSITVVVGGIDWQVGTSTTTIYADGTCGTYEETSTNYLPSGTFLGNDGTCDYFSDGAGGVYSSNCG